MFHHSAIFPEDKWPQGIVVFGMGLLEGHKMSSSKGNIIMRGLADDMPLDTWLNDHIWPVEANLQGEHCYAGAMLACAEMIRSGTTCFNDMCGECVEKAGLHVPEDLVHLDVYDPQLENFVADGECGRIVLTTLLPPGAKTGNLLLNYDTDDTTVVVTREKCDCGRTHMRILNPQREAETVWVMGSPFNRVDVEQGVFQRDNMVQWNFLFLEKCPVSNKNFHNISFSLSQGFNALPTETIKFSGFKDIYSPFTGLFNNSICKGMFRVVLNTCS